MLEGTFHARLPSSFLENEVSVEERRESGGEDNEKEWTTERERERIERGRLNWFFEVIQLLN